ncbi:MAG: glycosyltransferase [Ignavibacteriales bacterium]|nr:glycosyltransferase [Ignavibacteriales bacterium]
MNELERSLAFIPSSSDITMVKTLPLVSLPKISAVIPSFNQASFIQQTLDSIIAQKYPSLEIFVADGGSSDGTKEILDEYKSKYKNLIRYVSESDRGQFHAVNKGIEATDGEIIAWINSDDIYLPDTFWKVVTFFYLNRCALIVYGKNYYTDDNLKPHIEYPVDWSPILHEQKRRMMHFCIVPQPSLFFKRKVVVLSGKLVSPILDYELWMRWQRDLPFYFIDDFLSLSRLHSDAKTVKDRDGLIHGICETVHQYYHNVPYSWTRQLAYNKVYGNSWTQGEPTPVTRSILMWAMIYWIYYNLRWSPRTILYGVRSFTSWIKESIFGHV